MPVYNEDDYFHVLRSIIREDAVVPFSCYILLRANGRVVRFVAKDHPFEKAKMEKLKAFSFNDLYIQKDEYDAYCEYLRGFFKTEEGKAALKELTEEAKNGPILGLPEELAKELLPPITVTEAPKEAETAVIPPAAEESTPAISKAPSSLETLDAVGVVKVIDHQVPPESLAELIRSEAQAADESLRFQSELSPEEIEVVRGSIKKINEDLQTIEASPKANEDHLVNIKSVTQHLKEELERVKGVVQKPGRQYKAIQTQIDSLDQKITSLENPESLSTAKDATETLLSAVDPDPGKIVAEAIDQAVEKIQKRLKKKLDLKIIKNRPSESSGGIQVSESLQNQSPGNVKAKIEKQNQIIANLTARLEQSKGQFQALASTWDGLQSEVTKNLGENGKILSKSFGVHLRDLQTAYLGTQGESEQLKKSAEEVSQELGLKNQTTAPSTSTTQSSTTLNQEIDIPPESDENATPESLRSENSVLRSQLQDAKALIDNSTQKITELQTIIDENGFYIEGLEKESTKNKETLDATRERARELEGINLNLQEQTNAAYKVAGRAKSELQSKDQIIHQLRDELATAHQELKVFQARYAGINPADLTQNTDLPDRDLPTDVISMMKAKDEFISRLKIDFEQKELENKRLEKENARLKNSQQESVNLKKRVSQQIDRIEAEKENLRTECQAANRRLTTATNLLDTERKTILKLTSLTEDLKRDRVEFMSKTNSAMKGYKDMMSKANSLTNHVQSEIQRNKKIQDQLELLKNKNRELIQRLSDSEKERKELDAQVKKLSKAAA